MYYCVSKCQIIVQKSEETRTERTIADRPDTARKLGDTNLGNISL